MVLPGNERQGYIVGHIILISVQTDIDSGQSTIDCSRQATTLFAPLPLLCGKGWHSSGGDILRNQCNICLF